MAFIRDPRPVWQQVFSGLKIAAVLIAVGASALLLWPYIPVHRIEAYVWHLRHGNSIDIGQYRVPVPKQWYVWPMERNSLETGVIMTDLNSGDVISVDTNGLTLSAWSDLMKRSLASKTLKATGQRSFSIRGEKFLCIEQDWDEKFVHYYPIQCQSDGGLEVHFQSYPGVGRKHDAAFYSLLQRIQRR